MEDCIEIEKATEEACSNGREIHGINRLLMNCRGVMSGYASYVVQIRQKIHGKYGQPNRHTQEA